MAYLVNITSCAECDLAPFYGEISVLKWYRGLKEAILSLEMQPNRCPVTRRREKLRHLLYGHNPTPSPVIFGVLENQVRLK